MFKRLIASILTFALLVLPTSVLANDEEYAIELYSVEALARQITQREVFSEKESSEAFGISEAARNMKSEYVFSTPVSATEFSNIMSIVYNEYPDLFHLNSAYSYVPMEDPVTGEATVKKILLKYTMTEDEYKAGLDVLEEWCASVVSLGSDDFSEEQWALFFHDYLASVYSYDDSLEYNTAYDIVTRGIGVCRAYHLAYMYLLRAVGVECTFAVSSEMVHVWTMVKVNGNWHHVDALWDDGMDGAWGRATHSYFLLSDAAISDEEGGHYGWISKYIATCNNHGRDDLEFADSAFTYGNGKWYYLKDGVLSATDDPAVEGTAIVDLGLQWHVWGDSGAAYVGNFSGIVFRGGDIIFNGENNVYAYDTVTKAIRVLWENTEQEGHIFGFTCIGDTLRVNIAKSPSEVGTEAVIEPFVPLTEIKGDVSGDTRVNLNDASALMKYTAGWSVGINKIAADLNGDGRLNLSDVSMLMKILAGWNV